MNNDRNGTNSTAEKIIKFYERTLLIGAGIISAVLVAIYFVLDNYLLEKGGYAAFFQSLIVNLLAASTLFFMSYLFLRNLNASKIEIVKDNFYQSITDLVQKTPEHPEILNVSYSNTETPWNKLLQGATDAHVCIFYSNDNWNSQNFPHFSEFAMRGGKLTFYLPNPLNVFGRFFGESNIEEGTSEKIIETYVEMLQDLRAANRENVKIVFSDRGFNFMFARINKSTGAIFMVSPYPNEHIHAPAIFFDEQKSPPHLREFAAKELNLLTQSSRTFNFEECKYIVWSKDASKVFVSSQISCPAKCKFCFVESIKNDSMASQQPKEAARLFCMTIKHDKRFKPGPSGTTIMLGGYTDPFHKTNIDFSIEFLKAAHDYLRGNFIHIATRFPLEEMASRIDRGRNSLIVNFSISSFEVDKTRSVEPTNQTARFEDARALIEAGFKVALFVRPVIRGLTIQHVSKISDAAKAAGIKVITVGGLYVDQAIRTKLADAGVSLDEAVDDDSHHVLDLEHKLKKIKLNDVAEVREYFESDGYFRVFGNATERIEYFRSKDT